MPPALPLSALRHQHCDSLLLSSPHFLSLSPSSSAVILCYCRLPLLLLIFFFFPSFFCSSSDLTDHQGTRRRPPPFPLSIFFFLPSVASEPPSPPPPPRLPSSLFFFTSTAAVALSAFPVAADHPSTLSLRTTAMAAFSANGFSFCRFHHPLPSSPSPPLATSPALSSSSIVDHRRPVPPWSDLRCCRRRFSDLSLLPVFLRCRLSPPISSVSAFSSVMPSPSSSSSSPSSAVAMPSLPIPPLLHRRWPRLHDAVAAVIRSQPPLLLLISLLFRSCQESAAAVAFLLRFGSPSSAHLLPS